MIGQSPQDFLIRYRMSKATSLLTSTSLSIGDISVQVGYPNQLHFSRAFRNIYGMSPSNIANRTNYCPESQAGYVSVYFSS